VKSSTGKKGEAGRSLDPGIWNLHHFNVVQAMGAKAINAINVVCGNEGASSQSIYGPSVVTPLELRLDKARGGVC